MDGVQNSIVETLLLEYIGVFKILNPHVLKFYKISCFEVATKFQMSIGYVTLIMLVISVYYAINDVNMAASYVMLVVIFFSFNFSYHYLLNNSNEVWNLLRVMNINFLYFKTPSTEMFKAERFKHKMATTVSLILMINICISWLIMPLSQRDSYISIIFKNESYHYDCTPLNLILPISDTFYNKHSFLFYIFDAISVICGCHISLFLDFIVITICISIECQLKSIANSYSTLFMENSTMSKYFFVSKIFEIFVKINVDRI